MVLTTKYGFSLLGFPSSLQMGILGYWDFVPTKEGEEGLPIPSFYQFLFPETKYALELSKSVMKYI